ncbi:hypothetical protein V1478_018778 [Vespula squamosa]|uniref:Uncharacterized protein n=1 Tax=Vespula squamosa TaxID=30214 RepID=A0ABD1ZUF9_VESSQ
MARCIRLFLNRLESISRRRKFDEAAGKPIMYWSEDYVSKQSRNGRTARLTGSSSIGSSNCWLACNEILESSVVPVSHREWPLWGSNAR